MLTKQWYFSPAEPALVPLDLLQVLSERGIDEKYIKLCVKSDLNREMVRSDCYLLGNYRSLRLCHHKERLAEKDCAQIRASFVGCI